MNGVQHKVVGVGFGIAGAYAVIQGQQEPLGIAILLGSTVGCMLPDIDHDKTKIGRKRKLLTDVSSKIANIIVFGGIAVGTLLAGLIFFGFLNYGIDLMKLMIAVVGLIFVAILRKLIGSNSTYKWATKHRGLMHTLVVPVIFAVLYNVTKYPLWQYVILGLLIGYCSHLFADMCTVEGCPILWPLTKKNIRILKLQTKDNACTVAAWIIFFAVIGLSYVIVNNQTILPLIRK